MKHVHRLRWLLLFVPALVASAGPRAAAPVWSPDEVAVIASMQLDRLPEIPSDPSNRYDRDPKAVALGRQLFFDRRLSANGTVSCASCHDPGKGFQDGLPVGHGVGTGRRRSMPIADAARSPWLFWDGRKDSLWSQALGPLEDAAEHGGTRVTYVRQLAQHYADAYEALFGPLPDRARLPQAASPLGTPAQRAAWEAMDLGTRDEVNRAYANLGKAIAAYERTLRNVPTRFDVYAAAIERGDPRATQMFTASEVHGLRVFISTGQCVSCHSGPLLSDQSFHNTGVPGRSGQAVDRGRRMALSLVANDPFNCRGPYSDAKPGQCLELAFMPQDDPALDGAFKTPGLRGVADRPPYMHAGQFATLDEVLAHYRHAPTAVIGTSELTRSVRASAVVGRQPIRLSAADVAGLKAFLGTLSPASTAMPGPSRAQR